MRPACLLLHSGRDLAVSAELLVKYLMAQFVPLRPFGLCGTPSSFQKKASLLAPLASRRTGITRYLAPLWQAQGECSDFPLFVKLILTKKLKSKSDYLACLGVYILTQKKLSVNCFYCPHKGKEEFS